MTDKALPRVGGRPKYSRKLARQIHSLVLDGHSYAAIAEKIGVHRNTILNWKRSESYFARMMEGIDQQLAEVSADKILELSEKTLEKDEVPGARLHFDIHKWNAEKRDPSKFGNKVTHAGDKDNPIQFVVSTGFPEPNQYQTHPQLGSDGLIQKSGADAPLITKEEG